MAEPTASEILGDAMLDAALAISAAIGFREGLGGEGQILKPASIDLEQVPGAAVTTARSALDLLCVGIGLLDRLVEDDVDGFDEDLVQTFLAHKRAGG